MDKEWLQSVGSNPEFVAGIHNYCDRWCERCLYTRFCAVYAMGEKQEQANPGAHPFEYVSEMLAATMDMIRQWAEKHGVDLEADAGEGVEDYEAMEAEQRKHPLAVSAMEYYEKSRQWFESAGPLYEQKGLDLETLNRLEIDGVEPDVQSAELADCTDIILWYQHFIPVKLHRAVGGLLEKTGDPELDEVHDYDSNGSAKIALLAIDRSMAAWARLLEHFPNQENEILDRLVHLERLRWATEKTFPLARAFIRPGLDENLL